MSATWAGFLLFETKATHTDTHTLTKDKTIDGLSAWNSIQGSSLTPRGNAGLWKAFFHGTMRLFD